MNVAAIPVVFVATAAKQEKSNCNCFDRKQLNLHQHNNRENEQLALSEMKHEAIKEDCLQRRQGMQRSI